MRFKSAVLSAAILFSVFASHAVVAQVDEFTQFQNDLRRKGGAGYNPGMVLPGANNADRMMGNAPQTPEELQLMMEQEAQEQKKKFLNDAGAMIRASELATPEEKAFPDAIVADSAVSEVTVFSNSAKVTRTATVSIPAGNSAVVFDKLPGEIVPETLQVRGNSDAKVIFGAVASKQVTPRLAFDARMKTLYNSFEVLEGQLQEVAAERSALEIQSRYLSAIKPPDNKGTEDKPAPKQDPAQLASVGKSLRDGMGEVFKSLVQLNTRQQGLRSELDGARKAFFESFKFPQPVYAVMIPLSSDKAAKMNIEITYQVSRATWEPLYEIRLGSGGTGDVKITQYGQVRQSTGEDWKNAVLTLSTAQPYYSESPRALESRWIDIREKPKPPESVRIGKDGDPLQEWRQKTEAKRLSMEQEAVPEQESDQAPEVVPMVQPIHPQPAIGQQRAAFSPASITTGGFVTEYKIPALSVVPSDGGNVKLMVGEFGIEGKLQVHVKPQANTKAFLAFHCRLTGNSPLYPGQAHIFRDGAYSGQMYLPLLRPGLDHDLYFGVDDRVSVKRSTVKNEMQESGLISPDNVLEREYVTEVENLHETPITLVVEEIVPTSKNEKLVLDISKEKTTQGFTVDTENKKGLLQWNLEVPPQTKQELKLSWKLSWPKDFVLTGM